MTVVNFEFFNNIVVDIIIKFDSGPEKDLAPLSDRVKHNSNKSQITAFHLENEDTVLLKPARIYFEHYDR